VSTLWGKQEAVIAEMVVTVADRDIERHTAVKLFQVGIYIQT